VIPDESGTRNLENKNQPANHFERVKVDILQKFCVLLESGGLTMFWIILTCRCIVSVWQTITDQQGKSQVPIKDGNVAELKFNEGNQFLLLPYTA